MKKYQKPMLLVEKYSLGSCVAACGWDMNNQDPLSCEGVLDPDLENNPDDMFVLFTDPDRCSVITDNMHGYCYFTGSGDHARIFTS